jgi:hypothetical protein
MFIPGERVKEYTGRVEFGSAIKRYGMVQHVTCRGVSILWDNGDTVTYPVAAMPARVQPAECQAVMAL